MGYHHKPLEWLKSKMYNSKHQQGCEPSHNFNNVTWYRHSERFGSSEKVKHAQTIQLSTFDFQVSTQRNENIGPRTWKQIWQQHYSLQTKHWEQSKFPSIGKLIKCGTSIQWSTSHQHKEANYWPWPGNSADSRIVLMHQSCRFNPWPGHIR